MKRGENERKLSLVLQRELGSEIRRLRGGRRLVDLAEAAGTDAGNISRIETGQQQPAMGTLEGIAKFLGVPMSELLRAAEGDHRPAKSLSTHAVKLGRVFDDITNDNARSAAEDYVLEVATIARTIPTYYDSASPRRSSFEEKLFRLTKVQPSKKKGRQT